MKQRNNAPKTPNRWLLLPLLLTGCATQSPISASVCPQLPTPPVLQQPMPPQAYSISASATIKKWQESLTGTGLTSKP